MGRYSHTILTNLNFIAAVSAFVMVVTKPVFINNSLINMLFLAGLSSFILPLYIDIYKSLVYIIYIIITLVVATFFKKKINSSDIQKNIILISTLLVIGEVGLLYYLSNPLDVVPNEFLSNGILYGFGKGTISIILVLPLYYLFSKKRLISFFLLLLFLLPVLISMRIGFFSFLLTLILYIIRVKLKVNTFTVYIIGWFIALLAVAIGVYFDSFDRLPSYMISLNIISLNFFGLGPNQYSNYVLNNYPMIIIEFGKYISRGYKLEIWNSPESMFCQIIADFGFLGILVIMQYLILMYQIVRDFNKYNEIDLTFMFVFCFIIFSSLAHDYSRLDLYYYSLLGIIIGIYEKYTVRN